MHKRRAIGTSNFATVVTVAIIIGVIGVAILASHPSESSPTTPTYSATSSASHASSRTSSAVYQVIEGNLTIRGQTANIPCTDLGFICPPANNALLSQVELVRYGSTYFYSHNQTAPTGEPGVQPTYDVWFTNSTVFCVSPAYPQNPTCPTLPYRQTTIAISTLSASSLDSSNGLRLSLSLSTNATGMLNVDVAELNTLDRANNVTLADNWPVKGAGLFLWTQAACADSPAGYEILQGNYGGNNYTEGTALFLRAQAPLQCAVTMQPNYLIFEPRSDIASNINKTISSLGTSSGFWMGKHGPYYGYSCPDPSLNPNPVDYCPLTFFPFAPGTYTVVAGDEWGQVVTLHFTVQD